MYGVIRPLSLCHAIEALNAFEERTPPIGKRLRLNRNDSNAALPPLGDHPLGLQIKV